MTTPNDIALLLGFDDQAPLGEALAATLGVPWRVISRHRFPDGEAKLTLPPRLPGRVALLRGLHLGSDRIVEALIAGPAARALGAHHVTLVAPYLPYMRQDIEFNPGEAVSQRHMAALLAREFDAVVTVDPHLHRIASLDEVMPPGHGIALTAAPLLGQWVASHVPGALLLAPDEEAEQWVRAAAGAQGLDHAVCHKQRHGDREVQVSLPDADVRGRAVVVIDDVASTGHTLMQAARGALSRGAASVDVAVTHGLFVGDALQGLRAAGVRQVCSTDSVPHPSNVVSVAPLLAAALRGR